MSDIENRDRRVPKGFIGVLACFSVSIYLISAIAFEMTVNTAIISTLAIYLVFVVGLLFL